MFMSFPRLLVAIFTFSIGVAVFAAWVSFGESPEPVSSIIDEFPDAISLNVCELSETAGKWVGKRVVIDATIYSVDDQFIVYPISGSCLSFETFDSFVFTDLDLDNYFGPNQNLKYILRDKRPKSEVDVRIEGIVRRAPKNNELVYYLIDSSNMTIISPLRKFTPKGGA
jgi:hypothetical protein